jgi:hypothetical protein
MDTVSLPMLCYELPHQVNLNMAIGQPKKDQSISGAREYKETHVNMFKESEGAIKMVKGSECWKTLTSQKDPAPPEG